MLKHSRNTAECNIGLAEYDKELSLNSYPYTFFYGYCIISRYGIPEYCLQYPGRLKIIL